MKLILLSALLSISSLTFAKSGEIVCFFTEPFVTVAVNTERTELTIESFDAGLEKALVNIQFELDDVIVLTSENVDLQIFTKIKGNDGMSDKEYDFEGVAFGITPNKLYGGCNLK